MPPHRVGILRRFGLKTGIHFAHFSLESQGIGYGFRGNYGSVWTYLSFQFQMSKKEREIYMRIRNGFEEFICLHSNLSNDNIIST